MLADGAQTLSVLATNAAGNTETVESPSVVVDNNGPAAPSQLSATAITGSTTAVQLTWSDPLNPPRAGRERRGRGMPNVVRGAGRTRRDGRRAARGSRSRHLRGAAVAHRYGRSRRTIQRRYGHRHSARRSAAARAVARSRAQTPRTRADVDSEGAHRGLRSNHVHLRAYDHSKRIAVTERSVRPAHGDAVLRLKLNEREAKASKISVSVKRGELARRHDHLQSVTSTAPNTPHRAPAGTNGGMLGVCSSGGGSEPVRVRVAAELRAVDAISGRRPSPARAGWRGRC